MFTPNYVKTLRVIKIVQYIYFKQETMIIDGGLEHKISPVSKLTFMTTRKYN